MAAFKPNKTASLLARASRLDMPKLDTANHSDHSMLKPVPD